MSMRVSRLSEKVSRMSLLIPFSRSILSRPHPELWRQHCEIATDAFFGLLETLHRPQTPTD